MLFIKYTGQIRNRIEPHGDVSYLDTKVRVFPSPWDRFNSVFLRTICHIHLSSNLNSKFNLPMKFVWYKAVCAGLESTVECCLLVNAHLYALFDEKFIAYLKRNYPLCHIVMYFSDTYDYFSEHYHDFPKPKRLRDLFGLVLSYNLTDVHKHGFCLTRPVFPNYSKINDNPNIEFSDLLFVGMNKGRLELLLRIYEICRDRGLKCDFHIMGVDESERVYSDMIHYNSFVPYDEVLERVKKTKCVINIIQDNASGVTMRDYEALGNGKLLLTNNYSLRENDFYNPRQIIWIDDFEDKIDYIKCYCHEETDSIGEYDEAHFYSWLEDKLKELM